MKALVACVLAAGCSGSGDGSGGVMLAVDSAVSTTTVNGAAPSSGDTFIVVTLSLDNTGAKVALGANPVLFSLTTSDALEYSTAAAQPDGACDPTVSLASGGHVQCSIAFQVPTGTKPTTLAYDDQRGDTASATLPSIEQITAACTAVSGWLSDAAACGQCAQGELGGSGMCSTQAAAYESQCGSCKSQCETSFATLCTCEASCDTQACQTSFATFMSCVADTCQFACEE